MSMGNEVRASFFCAHCEEDTMIMQEYYMVHDEIFTAAIVQCERYSMLCIGCLEFLLGRELTSADFPDYPVNDIDDSWTKSDRLLDRLRRV
jgi:hypothetical protein